MVTLSDSTINQCFFSEIFQKLNIVMIIHVPFLTNHGLGMPFPLLRSLAQLPNPAPPENFEELGHVLIDTTKQSLHTADVHHIPFTNIAKPSADPSLKLFDEIVVDEKHYCQVNWHPPYSATASKRHSTNQSLVGYRTFNRISALDGSSDYKTNMAHCTIGAQGNNSLQEVDIPNATVGSVIITQHGAILTIVHQHGYHPTVGISIYCKVPFKWCMDSATDLAMTCDTGSQPSLPVCYGSLNVVCDQTPAEALAMIIRGSCPDLLGGEISIPASESSAWQVVYISKSSYMLKTF